MKTLRWGILSVLLTLTFVHGVEAADERTFDFEGLSGESEFPLTDQIPGLRFGGVVILTPAVVRSSLGIDLQTAPTGKSAASSTSASIQFESPVVEVRMLVSPSFLNVPISKDINFLTVHLTAYSLTGRVLARSTTPLVGAVPEREFVTNFRPAVVSISSPIPIRSVTLDLDEPSDQGGLRFWIDDLTITEAGAVSAEVPTLRFDRTETGETYLFWSFGDLEGTSDPVAGSWEAVRTRLHDADVLDTRQVPFRFFRVRRTLSPELAEMIKR